MCSLAFLLAVETHRTITRQKSRQIGLRSWQTKKIQHSNRVSRFYSQNISRLDFSSKTVAFPYKLYKFKPQTVVTQHLRMLQGKSRVSRGPILLLGSYSICPMSRFAERSHKSKKKQYNSSYCELGPPVFCKASCAL